MLCLYRTDTHCVDRTTIIILQLMWHKRAGKPAGELPSVLGIRPVLIQIIYENTRVWYIVGTPRTVSLTTISNSSANHCVMYMYNVLLNECCVLVGSAPQTPLTPTTDIVSYSINRHRTGDGWHVVVQWVGGWWFDGWQSDCVQYADAMSRFTVTCEWNMPVRVIPVERESHAPMSPNFGIQCFHVNAADSGNSRKPACFPPWFSKIQRRWTAKLIKVRRWVKHIPTVWSLLKCHIVNTCR